jgi:hypothetical protein
LESTQNIGLLQEKINWREPLDYSCALRHYFAIMVYMVHIPADECTALDTCLMLLRMIPWEQTIENNI